MTCYAVGILRNIEPGPDIKTYLDIIDGTLALFGGRFIIHGGRKHMLEGQTDDDLIVIEFPDREGAAGWYNSAAYQGIIDYRKRHSEGVVFLVDGVAAAHRAADVLQRQTVDFNPAGNDALAATGLVTGNKHR